MASIDLADFKGIVTAPGLLARSPASCLDAVNWDFPAPGVIRKRRGFQLLTGNAGGPVWSMLSSRLLGSNIFAHMGTASLANAVRYGDGSAALTALAGVDSQAFTRDPADGLRMHLAVANRNHFLTTDEGVRRVESDYASGGLARFAGMPRGLGPLTACVTFPTDTPFANGKSRAYRVTWHRLDADNTELGGAPTARWTITNSAYTTGHTGAACAFGMQIPVPDEWSTLSTSLSTAYFWRLWGTSTFEEATQLGNDECYLITERYLTEAEIALGYVTYTDTTPDSYLLSSPRLHTNLVNFAPSEAGIRQGVVNEDAPPPSANDVAYWQDCMWYADTTQRPTLTVGMIGLPVDGDKLLLVANGTSVQLTFKTAPALGTDVKIVTASSSTAINIRLTTLNLAAAIVSNCKSLGLDAFHVSTTSTEPGVILFEQRTLNGTGITVQPTDLTKWRTFGGTAFNANIEALAESNVLVFSKPVRPDAVPPINKLYVGSATSRILRVYPFQDMLLVFTDEGIFVVTGRTFADFAVYPFDLGFRLIGRQLVAECDERVYAWCNEGVVEIDSGGVRAVSTPIEPTIEALMVTAANGASSPLSTGRDYLGILGFAVAYRNQHQVRFHYPGPTSLGDMYACAYWLSFDTRTRAWSRGQFSQNSFNGYLDGRSAGCVRFEDDLLFVGSWSLGADTYLFRERRTYTNDDFQDEDRNGDKFTVYSTMRLQFQVPDAEGAQHWQQTVINWDAEEVSWRALPTEVLLTHITEEASQSQTVAVSELATRIEPALAARRGQRLAVQLVHNASEYAGIIGVSQGYRLGTRFARRVSP